jgi:hypothetical protein
MVAGDAPGRGTGLLRRPGAPRFCLSAAPAEAGWAETGWAEAGWVLSTVSPDLGAPRPITVGNLPAD